MIFLILLYTSENQKYYRRGIIFREGTKKEAFHDAAAEYFTREKWNVTMNLQLKLKSGGYKDNAGN